MPVETEEEKAAKIATVKKIYDSLEVGDEAVREIQRYHEQAMQYASQLGLGKIRYEMLHRYADMLLGRRK